MKLSAYALTALVAAAVPAFGQSSGSGSAGSGSTGSSPGYEYLAEKGQACNVAELQDNGYTVINACCDGPDPDRCPEYKHCRIADVAENNDVTCRCVTEPAEGDKCDEDMLWPIGEECSDDAAECRVESVSVVADEESDEVVVFCADVETPIECECYAYDSCDYCRNHPPEPVSTGVFHVSVCGDATYAIETNDETQICSGSGAAPEGTLCPKKGDVAVEHCRKEVWSYGFDTNATEDCTAPEDAQCLLLSKTGAWGCVFPTNANEKRGCLTENVCTDDYKRIDGTDLCQCTEAGYPIMTDTSSPDYIDTTVMEEPAATVTYKSDDEGLASMTNILSVIVGLFTSALTLFASL